MSDKTTQNYHADAALRAAEHRRFNRQATQARDLAARRALAVGPGRCETLPFDAPASVDPSMDYTGFCARGVI